jgi:hypothetical protein
MVLPPAVVVKVATESALRCERSAVAIEAVVRTGTASFS